MPELAVIRGGRGKTPLPGTGRPWRTHRSPLVDRRPRYLLALAMCAATLVLLPVRADMVIELVDGRTITVPVEEEEVERIRFTAPRGGTPRARSAVTAAVTNGAA